MTRIHYEIDDDLHRTAKAMATLQGVTLKTFVENALRAEVLTQEQKRRVFKRQRHRQKRIDQLVELFAADRAQGLTFEAIRWRHRTPDLNLSAADVSKALRRRAEKLSSSVTKR